MRIKYLLYCLIIVLAGCAAQRPEPQALYRPAQDARIRVIGSNGISIRLYPGSACAGGSADVIWASGGFSQTMKSFFHTARNHGIGMPLSARATHLQSGLAYKEFYNEYVIPGGVPIAIKTLYSNVGVSTCEPPPVRFVPEAGHDYELWMQVDGGVCRPELMILDGRGGSASVPLAYAQKCGS